MSESVIAILVTALGFAASLAYQWARGRVHRHELTTIREETAVKVAGIQQETAAKVDQATETARAEAEKQRLAQNQYFIDQTKESQIAMDRLRDALDKLRDENLQTATSNAGLRAQVDMLVVERTELTRLNAKYAEQYGETSERLTSVQKAADELRNRVRGMEYELAQKSEQLTSVEAERLSLRQKVQDLDAMSTAQAQQLAQLEEKRRQRHLLLTELQIKMSKAEAERDEALNKLTLAQRELTVLRAKYEPDSEPVLPQVAIQVPLSSSSAEC